MKTRNLAALVGTLLLMGPAVGVSIAAEKPVGLAVSVCGATNNTWQAVSAVPATPMVAADMDAVTGKGTNIFAFLQANGTSTTIGLFNVKVWTSIPH
jgi:hypothetical protein